MTAGAMIWLMIFLVAALVFFGLAAVITILGFKDLRDLLSHRDTGLKRPYEEGNQRGRSDFL